MIKRGPESFNALSRKHGAHSLDGYRNHQGYGLAQLAAQFSHGQDAGFDVPCVLASLEQEQICPALNEAARLLQEIASELIECHPTGNADRFGGWTHGAGDKARFCRCRVFIGCLASKLS